MEDPDDMTTRMEDSQLPRALLLSVLGFTCVLLYAHGAWCEEVVAEPVLRPFCDITGHALGEVNRKWGFCEDRRPPVAMPFDQYALNGAIVKIPPQYAWVGVFRDGIARVSKEGKFTGHPILDGAKWGFINVKNEPVIPFAYEQAEDFFDGYARVSVNGHWGLIDKSGKYVIAPKYDRVARPACERVAVYLNNQWGFCDLTGGEVVPPKYESVDDFHENFARVRVGNRRGWVDLKGREIAIQFPRVGMFNEDLAAVRTDEGKCGFVDGTGDFALKPQWSAAGRFGDGLAAVEVEGKYGYIDKTGTMVIPAKSDRAEPFGEGLAIVYEGKSCGFIRKNGEYAYAERFLSAHQFSNGVALVIKPDGGKYSKFKISGEYEKPPEWTGQFMAPYPPDVPDFGYENTSFDRREWGFFDDVLGATPQ